jgi:hypothetical protein
MCFDWYFMCVCRNLPTFRLKMLTSSSISAPCTGYIRASVSPPFHLVTGTDSVNNRKYLLPTVWTKHVSVSSLTRWLQHIQLSKLSLVFCYTFSISGHFLKLQAGICCENGLCWIFGGSSNIEEGCYQNLSVFGQLSFHKILIYSLHHPRDRQWMQWRLKLVRETLSLIHEKVYSLW